MVISNTWVEVASAGCILQKSGTNTLMLAYAVAAPVTESTFSISHNLTQIFPAVAGKTLWAKSTEGDVNISVEDLA